MTAILKVFSGTNMLQRKETNLFWHTFRTLVLMRGGLRRVNQVENKQGWFIFLKGRNTNKLEQAHGSSWWKKNISGFSIIQVLALDISTSSWTHRSLVKKSKIFRWQGETEKLFSCMLGWCFNYLELLSRLFEGERETPLLKQPSPQKHSVAPP